jgi:hypothetical protein
MLGKQSVFIVRFMRYTKRDTVWKNAEVFNITLEHTYNNSHATLNGWTYFYLEEGFAVFLNIN